MAIPDYGYVLDILNQIDEGKLDPATLDYGEKMAIQEVVSIDKNVAGKLLSMLRKIDASLTLEDVQDMPWGEIGNRLREYYLYKRDADTKQAAFLLKQLGTKQISVSSVPRNMFEIMQKQFPETASYFLSKYDPTITPYKVRIMSLDEFINVWTQFQASDVNVLLPSNEPVKESGFSNYMLYIVIAVVVVVVLFLLLKR